MHKEINKDRETEESIFLHNNKYTSSERCKLCFSKLMTIGGVVWHPYYHESYISYPDTQYYS